MPSLDRESVIVALTEGVGTHFGAASRQSFRQQLERLERHEDYLQSAANEQQALIDLLAVASFYQSVIIPIRSSGKFISILRRAGATHLRVGGDKLDQKYALQASRASTAFNSMLSQLDIPEQLLTYPSLTKFIYSVKAFENRRQ